MTSKVTRLFTTGTFLFASALSVVACASKPPPRSTTTTRVQTKTTTDTGDNVSSDSTEKVTKQTDGSSTVRRTETTNTVTPPTQPK